MTRISIQHVVAAILALGLQACCRNNEEETTAREYEQEALWGPVLDEIRTQNETDEDRCAAACRLVAEEVEGVDLEAIERCFAAGDVDPEDPWAEANVEVTVTCTGTTTSTGFCTGRRPQGHHETSTAVDSVGAWFAAHAHLEAASVTAFNELAMWLEHRDAPASFVARCRAAAEDEFVHAGMMGRLANLRGSTLEPCVADAPSDDLLTVALHNAVEGCVHEAFAASIAAMQAQRAHDPALQVTFGRIAADELRHGQLAWDLHAWFLDELDEAGRLAVITAQRQAFAQLLETASTNARNTPEELGWPTTAAARVMAQAFAEQAMH